MTFWTAWYPFSAVSTSKYSVKMSLNPLSKNSSSFASRMRESNFLDFEGAGINYNLLLLYSAGSTDSDGLSLEGSLYIDLRVIEKVDPYPTLDSTLTEPPICSTIILQIDRPKPLPLGLDCLCSSN